MLLPNRGLWGKLERLFIDSAELRLSSEACDSARISNTLDGTSLRRSRGGTDPPLFPSVESDEHSSVTVEEFFTTMPEDLTRLKAPGEWSKFDIMGLALELKFAKHDGSECSVFADQQMLGQLDKLGQ